MKKGKRGVGGYVDPKGLLGHVIFCSILFSDTVSYKEYIYVCMDA